MLFKLLLEAMPLVFDISNCVLESAEEFGEG